MRLHLLRHGQALHNPRAEAARAAGCSFERFLELMKEDDAFDADLTDLGRAQARETRQSVDASGVELVVSSPLSRALDTAMLVMPDETAKGSSHFISHDSLRERSGWMLNARRRSRAELAARFPACSFALLETEEDELWTDVLEPTDGCAERGYQFLLWLWERSEREVAVVAHGGLFHYLLNEHPRVRADAATAARFGNTEWRSCTLACTQDGDARNFTLSADAAPAACDEGGTAAS